MNSSSLEGTDGNISQVDNNMVLENSLKKITEDCRSGCLRVNYDSILFFIYFKEGKPIYATNSLAPFERLERHLRRLSNQHLQLTNEVMRMPRYQFQPKLSSYSSVPPDYQGISWLLKEQYLVRQEIITLLRRLTREVFESLFCFDKPIDYNFEEESEPLPKFCKFSFNSYLDHSHKRLQSWQVFSSHIYSSYQRLYLVSQNSESIGNLTREQSKTICRLLKGLNFRQIGALIDQDELIVARMLYPSIVKGDIFLRDPKPPFDILPPIPNSSSSFASLSDNNLTIQNQNQWNNFNYQENIESVEKKWNLICVDDSREVHNDIRNFLDNTMFDLIFIEEPMNALTEILELEPDIILLSVRMPNLNGYELCGLLRNQINFKNIPIVLLSTSKTIMDITKSKLAGATDYLQKPLTKAALYKIVFKYLV